jgi:prepilin-type N-terminal cleavage/methylation domain-containing protein
LTAQKFRKGVEGGFTLIEMLIVIAIIGILAIAVLSAINPVEQTRKARDTRRKSNSAELLNALERYYATNEAYPSSFPTSTGSCPGTRVTSTMAGDLVTAGELKPEFQTRIATTGNELYVYLDSNNLMHTCYEVEAKANEASIDCPTAATLTSNPDYNCLPE